MLCFRHEPPISPWSGPRVCLNNCYMNYSFQITSDRPHNRPTKQAYLATALALLMGIITSCASPARHRGHDPALCNEHGSFEAGYNDGREGRPMESRYIHTCRKDLRDGARKGYREGHEKGKKEWDEMIQAQRERMQGTGSVSDHETAPSIPEPEARRGWLCEARTGSDFVRGYGGTRLEARQNAGKNCMSRYSRAQCSDIDCRRNH